MQVVLSGGVEEPSKQQTPIVKVKKKFAKLNVWLSSWISKEEQDQKQKNKKERELNNDHFLKVNKLASND